VPLSLKAGLRAVTVNSRKEAKIYFQVLEGVFKAVMILLILFGQRWAQAADIALSARALGMGNAYTAIVGNDDAIFYNPAGFAQLEGLRWTILDPAIGINNGDSFEEYRDLLDSGDMAATLNRFYEEDVSAYLGASKSLFSLSSFVFGAYGVADANFSLNNPALPTLLASYRTDYGFVLGWGKEFIPETLTVGVQARQVTRVGGEVPIGASTLASLDSEDIESQLARRGDAYAFDLGVNWSLPVALKPTMSFVWRDVGTTTFRPLDNALAPSATEQEMILGLGFKWESTLLDINTAFDYRYSNQAGQVGKKINMGIEFNMPLLDLRGGFHQGYYTAGLSFDMWLLRIDAATYGVELGAYPGQMEDRRYMLQFALQFAINPDFSFIKLARPGRGKHGRKLRR